MDGPEFSPKPKVEKIRLPAKRGWLEPFGSLPWKIHYALIGKRDGEELVSGSHPARLDLTPDTGEGGFSLNIYLNHSIPKEYRHIITFHELCEQEVAYENRIKPLEAHPKAAELTDEYAQQYLNPEQFAAYKQWEKNILDNLKK